MGLESVQHHANELLAECDVTVRPVDWARPREDQGVPPQASAFCDCHRPATAVVEYSIGDVLMFWRMACVDHAPSEVQIQVG
jgi:hypothetical protein